MNLQQTTVQEHSSIYSPGRDQTGPWSPSPSHSVHEGPRLPLRSGHSPLCQCSRHQGWAAPPSPQPTLDPQQHEPQLQRGPGASSDQPAATAAPPPTHTGHLSTSAPGTIQDHRGQPGPEWGGRNSSGTTFHPQGREQVVDTLQLLGGVLQMDDSERGSFHLCHCSDSPEPMAVMLYRLSFNITPPSSFLLPETTSQTLCL